MNDARGSRQGPRRVDAVRRSAAVPEAPRHLRVFVSSPGDVASERTIAREVLDRLVRDPLLRGQVTVDVVSWDDPAAPVPMMAQLSPQQAVDHGLPQPSQCDLTVVILWGRMGTPLAEPRKPDGRQYLSGTEYEFENARASGKPILLYRRTGSIPVTLDDPDLETKRHQKVLVDEFFERFKNPDGSRAGGYNSYEDAEAFRVKFEAHMKAFLRKRLESAGGDARQEKRGARRYGSKPAVPLEYRQWLQARCAGVELLGLRLRQGRAVRLKNVYVPLTTTRSGAVDEDTRRVRPSVTPVERDASSEQLLLDRLGESSTYVAGDPGSGKSTFCRWLAWLACEGAVPPAEIEVPDEYRERLAPTLANRLPLLVPLREFWQRLSALPDGPWSIRDLESAIAAWLEERGAPEIDGDLVEAHADAGTALFVFDGIDEVPPTPRSLLLRALADARHEWTRQGNRVVITSRPHALTDGQIRELGLPQARIQPLPDALQRPLVRRWFRILSDTAEHADRSTAEMLRQVREQAWLVPLTQNPLLLTGMCIVFGDGKGLPEDKYELYERVTDAVLYNRFPERLRLQLVRARLAVVAYGMHTGHGLGEDRVSPQAEVTHLEIDRMLRAYQERSHWTEQHVQAISDARDELLTQTGVLLPRGEQHAAFLHLSFQEFLAAQRIADVEADRIRDVFLERSHAPEWRNTLSFLFGSLLATSTTPDRAVRLLTELVTRLEPSSVGLTLAAADAAEVLLRRGFRLAPEVDDRLRQGCVAAMRGDAPARDRAHVGATLGRIGDPRFRADLWCLPDDDLLGFLDVPAGPFTMGSDKRKDAAAHDREVPAHAVTLPTYCIGKWPVTVAKFKAFVEDPDNGGFVPEDPSCVQGVGNHPVVNVSWYEALQYCRWLTARFRTSESTPAAFRERLRRAQTWQVMLASEAEWEKAARGTDGRIYAWSGEKAGPNRANYGETGIGSPSAVGCFPDGKSPYGVEELVGNVWEWTRSAFGEYPYEPDYEGTARESLAASDDVPRVVRGGAFDLDQQWVRAGYRLMYDPARRSRHIGFRVVVSPFSPD